MVQLTKYFFNILIRKQAQGTINEMAIDGQIADEPLAIEKHIT